MTLPLHIKITTHGVFPDLALIQQSLYKEGYIPEAGHQVIVRYMGPAGEDDPGGLITIITVQDVKSKFKE